MNPSWYLDDGALCYRSDLVIFCIHSELSWNGIKYDQYKYNTNPSNGDFELSWNEKQVTIYISRHGDGRAGSISVSCDKTGFKECVLQLQKMNISMNER